MNKSVSKDIDKKRKVFEAATRLFAQKGFDKTTVDEIAESAQVAKGTVYYYFKGKEEIFLFLVEEGIAILKTRITDALRDNQDDTRRALQQLFVVQLGFLHEYQDVCRILLADAWGISSRQEKLQELLNDYYLVVGTIIEQGIKEGVLYPQNSEVLCTAIFGMTVVVALHFLNQEKPVPWEQIEKQLNQLLIRGVIKPT